MTDAGWTREKPSKAGFYWWKRQGYDAAIVRVDQELHVWFVGRSAYLGVNCFDGEWLGPISPSTYHQGRVAGLKEAEKVAREWPWDRGPAHTNPLHVAKRKGERGASWCIAENIQSMIPLEQQAQGGQS